MQETLSLEFVSGKLPPRPEEGHKGTFGHMVAVVGSRGFTGAATLVCRAANRSGVGLVTAAIPRTLSDVVASSLVEPMTLALPATDTDSLAFEALDPLLAFCRGKAALAIGPGLGTHPSTARLVRRLYALCPVPMVVDADGLNALATHPERIKPRNAPPGAREAVLTPHPGEMARLTGLETGAIQEERAATAAKYAAQWGATVVLKGRGTVIAAPDGRVYCCPTGNNGMGTGGTGDVLTGIIGALLAQRLTPFDAACVGVFVHGLAGDIAAREKTPRAMVAGDIIDALPEAWRAVDGGRP